jgi:ubiquinone biosynthesis protein Coq4
VIASYRKREIRNDIDYITQRLRKTHDLHHILTGFSLGDCGEFGVISVSIDQIQHPSSSPPACSVPS